MILKLQSRNITVDWRSMLQTYYLEKSVLDHFTERVVIQITDHFLKSKAGAEFVVAIIIQLQRSPIVRL